MKVCVGITTKNRKNVLPKAIDSALAQDYPHCDVFVFDDGSTDGTFELKARYPEVRWERSEESLGLLEARNKMMSTCSADIFVSLDDDAWFLKNDEVSIAVEYFQTNEKLAAIAFDILEKGTYKFREVPRDNPRLTNFFIGCGHALRLEIVQKAGYYVPFPLKYGHEEKDLAIRMLDLGYEILLLPGVHVWHDNTPVERNKLEQDRGFIINDLIYKYRRVPLLYVTPVLGLSIYRTLRNRVRKMDKPAETIWSFFKLIPSESRRVGRVSTDTYKRYRALSKSLMDYKEANRQS